MGRRGGAGGRGLAAVEPKRILYVAEMLAACAWYRCHVPGSELRRKGHDVVLSERVSPGAADEYDILVFQRPSVMPALDAIRRANALGKLTVVDMDDDIWSIHPTNPAYAGWNDTPAIRVLEQCLREAALATTATRPLAEQAKRFASRVRVVPNMLPRELWPESLPEREPGRPLVVGWAGSASHFEDVRLLSGTIEQALEQFPEVRFVHSDLPQAPFPPHERISILPTSSDIEHYPEVLGQIDIGLAPLTDMKFNRSKSDLKFVEYGMMGIPTIASRHVAYESTIAPGVTGFLARNPKDWLKHLQRLLRDDSLREEMGRNARAYAETRTVERNIGNWERAYGLE